MTRIREARPGERTAVANVLDGAALAVEYEVIDERIETGAVLVAVEGARVLGALVLAAEDGPDERTDASVGTAGNGPDSWSDAHAGRGPGPNAVRITAIAVRRNRRGQGIGTALVEAAGARYERLLAEFDADRRPFWESLGFEVVSAGNDRYRGRLDGSRPVGGEDS